MSVDRSIASASIVDALDRALDKGIVLDAWVRIALAGIDVLTVEVRIVVASIETYLKYNEPLRAMITTSAPRMLGHAEPSRTLGTIVTTPARGTSGQRGRSRTGRKEKTMSKKGETAERKPGPTVPRTGKGMRVSGLPLSNAAARGRKWSDQRH